MKSLVSKPLLGMQVNWGNPLARGLVASWLFNEGAGSQAFDSSGNNNHGSLAHTSSPDDWAAGRTGIPALRLNDSSDYVNLPLAIFNQDAGSWGMWVYSNFSEQGVLDVRLFNSKHSSGANHEFRTYGSLAWYFGNGTTYLNVDIGALNDNAWNHIVFTWEYRSGTDDTLVKGCKAGNYVAETAISGKISIPDTNIYIGRWGDNYFNGKVDEVAIWNRALSSDEITRLYLNSYTIYSGRR